MGKENVALQASLLSYHLSQIRTTGSISGAFFALYKYAERAGPLGVIIRRISLMVFLMMASILFCSAKEFEYLIYVAKNDGDIPEDRARALKKWVYTSYFLSLMLVIAASILGVLHLRG
ncbi:hypothetical protein TetV_315 [Tetraselmis virus 1]|uniref:Uncharacterized protein n=1 Tax=Tetraselmis virus 1 TaxID=2060617 RepID=A0A2P0VNC5_9VIRU|nr:hypothetical protein QJ968_gp315 [Tetraselmis virus 1]AUF82407.1 hypothetical protein TetV_315 [Tetraselmis virus 1]